MGVSPVRENSLGVEIWESVVQGAQPSVLAAVLHTHRHAQTHNTFKKAGWMGGGWWVWGVVSIFLHQLSLVKCSRCNNPNGLRRLQPHDIIQLQASTLFRLSLTRGTRAAARGHRRHR